MRHDLRKTVLTMLGLWLVWYCHGSAAAGRMATVSARHSGDLGQLWFDGGGNFSGPHLATGRRQQRAGGADPFTEDDVEIDPQRRAAGEAWSPARLI